MAAPLNVQEKVVGLKQTRRAIANGNVKYVYLAFDADPRLVEPMETLCQAMHIPTDMEKSMQQLGKECGISVGTAACALLRD